MLSVEERFMIKELHQAGVTISDIARQTGHDRKTIRAALQKPLLAVSKARRPKVRKLEPYIPYLERRMNEGVYNAQKLYQELCEQGYGGKDRQVRAFVQPYRAARRQQATVRFETEPGQQAQVDWGSFGTILHQERQCRLYAFVMTLGWSRMMYLEFTISTDLAWWLRCHLHAFHYFGGVPKEVLHDNLKTAVLGRGDAGAIQWQPRYLDFAHYYGFRPRACQPYRAQTKGKVENSIKYVRGNFWPGLQITGLADLNDQGRHWLATVANCRVHGTTQAIPRERLALEGLQALQGKADYDTSLVTYRRSTKDCLVSYAGNYYSVPAAYAQQQLLLKETETGDLLICSPDGALLAQHRLAVTHHQRIAIASHYHELWPTTSGKQAAGVATPTPVVQSPALLVPDAPTVEVRSLQLYAQWAEVAP
jgi:transposase